jgi:micrococcal nuclease
MPAMRRISTKGLAIAALSFALGAGSMTFVGQHPSAATEPAAVASTTITAQLPVCARTHLPSCVVDGDTIRLAGESIRLADIDAPEIFSPKCASEKALGNRATARLVALINAGPVTLETPPGAHDKYGREIRVLKRDGESLGTTMVAEGLAHVWDGRRHGWCS